MADLNALIAEAKRRGMDTLELESLMAPKPSRAQKDAAAVSKAVTPPKAPPFSLQEVLKGLREGVMPTSKEALMRLHDPRAGMFGAGRVMESAGQAMGNIVEKTGTPGAGLIANQLSPSAMQQNIGAEGAGMAANVAVKAATPLSMQRYFAQQALGVDKGAISSQGMREATRKQAKMDRVTDEALKSDIISPTGAAGPSLKRAQKLLDTSKKELESVVTKEAPLARVYKDEIQTAFTSRFKTENPGEKEIFKSLMDQLEKTTDKAGSIDIPQAQRLKMEWNEIGFPSPNQQVPPDSVQRAYRKAADILDTLIQKGVRTAGGTKALSQYRRANMRYMTAINAGSTLARKVAAEKTRMNAASLMTGTIVGTGAGMAGDAATGVGTGLAVAGATEVGRRVGPGIAARRLYHGVVPPGASSLGTAVSNRRRKQ